ncbi:hypothetical protein J4G02_10615 [Candidatus Poribacteria bacterium]|nr:hypothetical protein [Candidatus Poribacteria bacterium]
MCRIVTLFFILSVSSAFSAIKFESVELGFDKVYKRERWAPLQVVVTSHNEDFNGEISVEVRNIFSDELIQTYATPLSLTRTDRQRRTIHVFLPGVSSQLSIKLVSHAGQVRVPQELTPELPKSLADLMILALTPSRDLLSRWDGKQIDGKEKGHAFVAYTDFKRLPVHWKGYDSVDFFVIRGVSLVERRMSKRQQQALLDWIQRGGTLLVSGGADLRQLRGSFLETFLPVALGGLRRATQLPESMQRFGLAADSPFDLIEFKSKPGTIPLVGDGDQIYIAKRVLGGGQIISLGFDYNAPPFSDSPGAEAFWKWLLGAEARTPRHAEARYEADRRHNEKIQTILAAVSSAKAPLIGLLLVFLVVYVLGFGALIWWGRTDKFRLYWVGGIALTVLFSCGVVLPRHFVPSPVSVNRFSILSVYPSTNRAHLQTYIGIIASASVETSIQFQEGTLIRPLTETAAPPLQLVKSEKTKNSSILRQAALDPWVTRAYFAEAFIDFPVHLTWERGVTTDRIEHRLPYTLENAWLIDQGEYPHIGTIPPATAVEIKENPKRYNRSPLSQALVGERKAFMGVLIGEVVLRYLAQELAPKLVGWTQTAPLPMSMNHPVDAVDETLVILYLPTHR